PVGQSPWCNVVAAILQILGFKEGCQSSSWAFDPGTSEQRACPCPRGTARLVTAFPSRERPSHGWEKKPLSRVAKEVSLRGGLGHGRHISAGVRSEFAKTRLGFPVRIDFGTSLAQK